MKGVHTHPRSLGRGENLNPAFGAAKAGAWEAFIVTDTPANHIRV